MLLKCDDLGKFRLMYWTVRPKTGTQMLLLLLLVCAEAKMFTKKSLLFCLIFLAVNDAITYHSDHLLKKERCTTHLFA